MRLLLLAFAVVATAWLVNPAPQNITAQASVPPPTPTLPLSYRGQGIATESNAKLLLLLGLLGIFLTLTVGGTKPRKQP
ncbi:MAG: hypothetical protein GC129_06345 [Proteobacteria bacterium]|nr:hypothetical protein [Pseudomonadota bacterium]